MITHMPMSRSVKRCRRDQPLDRLECQHQRRADQQRRLGEGGDGFAFPVTETMFGVRGLFSWAKRTQKNVTRLAAVSTSASAAEASSATDPVAEPGTKLHHDQTHRNNQADAAGQSAQRGARYAFWSRHFTPLHAGFPDIAAPAPLTGRPSGQQRRGATPGGQSIPRANGRWAAGGKPHERTSACCRRAHRAVPHCEEFRAPVGVRKSPRNEPAGRLSGGRYGELWFEGRLGVPGCCPVAARAMDCRGFFLSLPFQIGRFDAGCSVRWARSVIPGGTCGAAGANGIRPGGDE